MTHHFAYNGGEYWIDSYLAANLDLLYEWTTKRNGDSCLICDGGEGTGKSQHAATIAAYLAPHSFGLDYCVFTFEQFSKAVISAPKYSAIVWDESYSDASSRGSMSLGNRAMIALLTQSRSRNLFVIICLPSYFDLDRYLGLWRSSCLINHRLTGLDRGSFAFYGTRTKQRLYLLGKKNYSYHVVKPDFRGRFDGKPVYDMAAYELKKQNSFIEKTTGKDEPKGLAVTQRNKLIKYICEKYPLVDICDVAQEIGVSENSIKRWAKQ